MQDQKNAKLRSLSPLGMLDDDKDAKLDQMLEDKEPKDDAQPAEECPTDKDKKSAGQSDQQPEKDGDKTI